MFDILIKHGLIVDGSGKAAYTADLAIKDGKVTKIAPNITEPAAETLDATGLVVAPGFVDCHNHSDGCVFEGSSCYNHLEQGVTTEVVGHCGDSPAPYSEGGMLREKAALPAEEFQRRTQLAATPASFMEVAKQASIGTNMAFYLGHNTIRRKAMGFDPAVPNAKQLASMQDDIRQAMEAGYLGYSTGLIYAPSVYANTEELIELAKAMAPYKGIYSSHIRGEGNYVEEAVREAIRIGEEAGVRVQISHLKVIGLHNEGKSMNLLKMIDEANERGVEVFADQYPYTAGSAPLRTRIPPKYHVGGVDAFLERLKDPAMRKKMEYSIFHEPHEYESCVYSAGFDGTLISSAAVTTELVGKTIGQLAKDSGQDPMDVFCDVLLANKGVAQGIYFNQSVTDMMRILSHPRVFGGSDSSNYPDERFDPEQAGGRHLRGVTTMVRRLELQRDFRLCTLEESIHRITYGPAQALQLEGIGLLKEGWDANVTVFDYERLHATATYSHPCRENQGIKYVLVNGKLAVKDGRITGTRAGKVLTRSV